MTTGVYLWSTTAANNVNANIGVSVDEGWSPAIVNNSLRQLLADLRTQFNDLAWFQFGSGAAYVAPVYASSTSVTVAGVDVTSAYTEGRPVKAVGSSTGTIYGVVASSSFSTNTTINFTWASGSLSNETLTLYISQIPVTGTPISPLSISTVANATGTGSLVFQTSPSLVTPALGTPTSGAIAACTVNTFPVGYSGLPESGGAAKSADYTAVLLDANKCVVFSASGHTFTIPANASVAYNVGDTLTCVNISSGTMTIAINSDTLTQVNSTNTGSRTLAKNSIAVAIKVGSTSWIIQGAGLT